MTNDWLINTRTLVNRTISVWVALHRGFSINSLSHFKLHLLYHLLSLPSWLFFFDLFIFLLVRPERHNRNSNLWCPVPNRLKNKFPRLPYIKSQTSGVYKRQRIRRGRHIQTTKNFWEIFAFLINQQPDMFLSSQPVGGTVFRYLFDGISNFVPSLCWCRRKLLILRSPQTSRLNVPSSDLSSSSKSSGTSLGPCSPSLLFISLSFL